MSAPHPRRRAVTGIGVVAPAGTGKEKQDKLVTDVREVAQGEGGLSVGRAGSLECSVCVRPGSLNLRKRWAVLPDAEIGTTVLPMCGRMGRKQASERLTEERDGEPEHPDDLD